MCSHVQNPNPSFQTKTCTESSRFRGWNQQICGKLLKIHQNISENADSCAARWVIDHVGKSFSVKSWSVKLIMWNPLLLSQTQCRHVYLLQSKHMWFCGTVTQQQVQACCWLHLAGKSQQSSHPAGVKSFCGVFSCAAARTFSTSVSKQGIHFLRLWGDNVERTAASDVNVCLVLTPPTSPVQDDVWWSQLLTLVVSRSISRGGVGVPFQLTEDLHSSCHEFFRKIKRSDTIQQDSV